MSEDFNQYDPELRTGYAVQVERHLEAFRLSADNLRGSKVLDLGCAPSADFVKGLITEGITEDAYGMSLVIDPDPEFEGHLRAGSYVDSIPFDQCDYILSLSSVVMYTDYLYHIDPVKRSMGEVALSSIIRNGMHALKVGGEMRFAPVMRRNAPPEEVIPNYIPQLQSVLSRICAGFGASVVFEEGNTYKVGQREHTDFLCIIKKGPMLNSDNKSKVLPDKAPDAL